MNSHHMTSPQKSFSNQRVFLSDLLDRDDPHALQEINGFTFEKCQIYGPVVLIMGPDNTFRTSQFDTPSLEAMTYELQTGPRVGAITLQNCSFTECVLTGVGFAGSKLTLAPLLGIRTG